MNLEIINPTEYPDWDEMLLRTPDGSFFHSSAWARVLAESYGYTPLYFTVREGHRFRVLVPVMEINSFLTGKRGVSLPFTDYCEPLVDETICFQDLFNHIVEFGKIRGWKYFEIRGGEKYLIPHSSFLVPMSAPKKDSLASGPLTDSQKRATIHEKPATNSAQSAIRDPQSVRAEPGAQNECVTPFITYLGHTLDLTTGEEKILSSLRDSTRRNIKKARSQGVVGEVSREADGIREFYRLNCITRKEHGLPPQPYHFFQRIQDHVISKDHGFVTLASYQGRKVAGAVFLYFGDTAIYKYGASDKKIQGLRANNLVMWEGMKWLCNHGVKTLSLGRTEMENSGLRQFKDGWGTFKKNLSYYRWNLKKNVHPSTERNINSFLRKILRKLPGVILKIAGSLFYRHIG